MFRTMMLAGAMFAILVGGHQVTARPHGDMAKLGQGIAVEPHARGASLRCIVQRLAGEVGPQGLELVSTVPGTGTEKFSVRAVALGCGDRMGSLPEHGTFTVADGTARWIRSGLTEEYSVSMDGVRQDFLVAERPAGHGELRLELALSGADAETAKDGVHLVLDGSGRRIAYRRLLVTDAAGRRLAAGLDVVAADRLAVRVDLAGATFPVRIDPTFSDANWISMGEVQGADDDVYAFAVDPVSGAIYVGGRFTTIGGIAASRIAKWDGSAWSTLGAGVNSSVWAIQVGLDGTVYAGGDFWRAGEVSTSWIAQWNGTAWSAMGDGLSGSVSSMAMNSAGNLYVGGLFDDAGGVSGVNNVAMWNGTAWSALGSGLQYYDEEGELGYGNVESLVCDGTNLYVGGFFTRAGGMVANHVAQWNGTAWSALGDGMSTSVEALLLAGSDLYAGGWFSSAGGIQARYVARWDGSTWHAVGDTMRSAVLALAMDGDGTLYAGGRFTEASSAPGNRIAKWDGATWTAMGTGADDIVEALMIDGAGNLLMGGRFVQVNGMVVNHLAMWDGAAWSGMGSGLDDEVLALAADADGNLYAGGAFTRVLGMDAARIAKWDGTAWATLGTGMDDVVRALVLDDAGGLYAGGDFTTAGGIAADHVAYWDGDAWAALSAGTDGSVAALALDDDGNLFAGGSFATAGGAPAAAVARWAGGAWAALGTGMDDVVRTLALDAAGSLYAGGDFTTAGGVAASHVARWDGAAWAALGDGVNDHVHALAIDDWGRVHAGGAFTVAGGVPVGRLARWDGTIWAALGDGVNGPVNALSIDPAGNLLAGGEFTEADGEPASNIARWDGAAWSALGSGVDGPVKALAADGEASLYAGGDFTVAGGKPSPHLAKAIVMERLACGLVFTVLPGDIGLDLFRQKPKIYAVYYDLAKDPRREKPKKTSAKILTKVSKDGTAALDGEWTKKLRLYDAKGLKAAEKGGDSAGEWLKANQRALPLSMRIAGKQVPGLDQPLFAALLVAPEIITVTAAPAGDTLTLEGLWFGTKAPKVWREYTVPGKELGTFVTKRQGMKVLKPNEANTPYRNHKGKPVCMDPDTGESKVIVVVPTDPNGPLNGTVVLDNGVGLAAGDAP